MIIIRIKRASKWYFLLAYTGIIRHAKVATAILVSYLLLWLFCINSKSVPNTCKCVGIAVDGLTNVTVDSTVPTMMHDANVSQINKTHQRIPITRPSTTMPVTDSTTVPSTTPGAIMPPDKPDSKFFLGPKLGVLLYIPYQEDFHYLIQFTTFIYASWHFMLRHHELAMSNSTNPLLSIDLLVYCHPKTCSYLPDDCFYLPQYIHRPGPACLWHPTSSFDHGDKVVDSFAFIRDSHFYHDIIQRYIYLMRSDVDTFLTPSMLTWYPPSPVVVGNGGYCDPFNQNQLKRIANESGLRHQGVHCLGSTWYGESNRIMSIANLTVRLVKQVYENEFDPATNPDIAVYMNKSTEGEWPFWWRPVSVLYGSELALNHLVDNLTDAHRMRTKLDVPSCTKTSIFLHPHIHTWHDDCEFQKFRFMDPLVTKMLGENGTIPVYLSFIAYRNPAVMSVSQYCTYVARNALYQYLPWFQNLAENTERPMVAAHED